MAEDLGNTKSGLSGGLLFLTEIRHREPKSRHSPLKDVISERYQLANRTLHLLSKIFAQPRWHKDTHLEPSKRESQREELSNQLKQGQY